MRHRDRPPPRPQHIIDIEMMRATELRQKYKLTYDSWRNMKTRAKKEGFPVEPEFLAFRDFLRHMGPRTAEHFTVDRRNRRTYGPMNCRWLDKKGQSNNRDETIFLTCDGIRQPLTVWAEQTGQKPSTLRARRARGGHSDCEVIHGKHRPAQGFGRDPFEWRPWPSFWPDDKAKQDWWEETYRKQCRHEDHLYRLRFLIRGLTDQHRRDGDFLCLYDGDRRPEMREKIAEVRERYARVNAHLTKALALLPQWETAANAAAKARQHRRRDYDDPEDDECDD